jgi:hypothetical protein
MGIAQNKVVRRAVQAIRLARRVAKADAGREDKRFFAGTASVFVPLVF